MAVIGKIRSYSGLLIVVIGIALAAFVLGDFFGYGPSGRQTPDVGKIGKNAINYMEFERRAADQLENLKMETGMTVVSPMDAFQVRQQVWNSMVREYLLDAELEKLGINVSPEELFDMIHGRNPHSLIVRSFTNPADGSFDPQQVISFLRSFDQLDPSIRNQWTSLEQFIKRERAENKYQTLIRKGYHVPAILAARDFQDRNNSADFRLVYKTYSEIEDSLVKVSDRDLRRVYDENKERFRRDASRGLEYVTFTVAATQQDMDLLRAELEELRDEFVQTEDLAAFVNAVSDQRFDPRFLGRNEMSPLLAEVFQNAEPGAVFGPYTEDNAFILARLADIQFRPDSMRASHILVAFAGSRGSTPDIMRSMDEARERADSILQVVRRAPGRFGELAGSLSDDLSASFNQGDLEWFPDGAMVTPFNEAVVNASVGSFLTVETDFGVHVVHVTGKSALARKYQVAKLTRNIEPSSQTYQSVYAQASEFASGLRKNKNFREVAEEQDLVVRMAENIRSMDISLPGIDNPRPIIQWAFWEDTKKGSVSRIFELDNRFVVATVTRMLDEGIPPLDMIRDEVMALAVREKKFETISQQMKQAGTTLDQVAAALQSEAEEMIDIRFTAGSLPGIGAEPAVVGTVFGLESGMLSSPVKGNLGVFMAEVMRKDAAAIPEDLSPNKRILQSSFGNRVPGEVLEALRKSARITDNRVMFY